MRVQVASGTGVSLGLLGFSGQCWLGETAAGGELWPEPRPCWIQGAQNQAGLPGAGFSGSGGLGLPLNCKGGESAS